MLCTASSVWEVEMSCCTLNAVQFDRWSVRHKAGHLHIATGAMWDMLLELCALTVIKAVWSRGVLVAFSSVISCHLHFCLLSKCWMQMSVFFLSMYCLFSLFLFCLWTDLQYIFFVVALRPYHEEIHTAAGVYYLLVYKKFTINKNLVYIKLASLT